MKYIILFCLLFASIKLSGQDYSLKGTVELSDGGNQTGIMVQLLDTTATEVVAFRTTDSKGAYQFKNLKQKHYKLYVNQFGYSDTFLLVYCKELLTVVEPIRLMPLSIEMTEISVIDKAILLKKSGDTTIFNIKLLEKGDEQSVTDIIDEIPGFSLEGTQILYQNKPLKNILIDGKDISDENHIQFTDGVLYQSIKDIRLIENYSDGYEPYADTTKSKVAMDISLKEKYKGKWQGTIYGGGGYNKVYETEMSVIKVNKNNALNIKGGSSNLDENFNEFDQSSYIKKIENEALFNSRHTILLQKNLHQASNLRSSNNAEQRGHYMKMTFDQRFSNRIKFRTKYALYGIQGNQERAINRVYRTMMTTQNSREISSVKTWKATIDNSLSIPINTVSNLQIEFPAYIQNQDNSILEDGTIANVTYKNESEYANKAISITPLYKFHANFSKNWTLSIFGEYNFAKNKDNLQIVSNDDIAGSSVYFQELNLFGTQQEHTLTSNKFNNQLRLRKLIKNFDIQYNLSYNNNKEVIDNSSGFPFKKPFVGQNELKYTSLTNAVRIFYDKRPIRLAASIIYAQSKLAQLDNESEKTFFKPRLFAMYRLNQKWNISSSYVVKIYQPTILQTTNLWILRDQVTLDIGSIPVQTLSVKETYSLSIFKELSISREGSIFNASISFSPATEEVQPISQVDNSFQINSFAFIKRGNEWTAISFFSKHSDNWNTRFDIRVLSTSTEQDGNTITDRMLNTTFRVKYSELKNFKFLADLNFRFTHRYQQEVSLKNYYIVPRIRAEYTKGLSQHLIYSQLIYNNISNQINTYYQINYEFTRKKLWQNFEFTLKFDDILNLSSNTITTTFFDQNYVQTHTYKTFPGRIMLGLKWYVGQQ